MEEAAPGVHSRLIGRAYLAIVLAERGAHDEAAREASLAVAEVRAARDRLAEGAALFAMAYVLHHQGAHAAAEQELRNQLVAHGRLGQGLSHAKLAATLLGQGDAAGSLSMAREVIDPAVGASYLARIVARTVEAEALLAMGERTAAQALLTALRAEILEMAARIEDEALREAFLTRGPWTARVLRLADAEGAAPDPPRPAPRTHR